MPELAGLHPYLRGIVLAFAVIGFLAIVFGVMAGWCAIVLSGRISRASEAMGEGRGDDGPVGPDPLEGGDQDGQGFGGREIDEGFRALAQRHLTGTRIEVAGLPQHRLERKPQGGRDGAAVFGAGAVAPAPLVDDLARDPDLAGELPGREAAFGELAIKPEAEAAQVLAGARPARFLTRRHLSFRPLDDVDCWPWCPPVEHTAFTDSGHAGGAGANERG